MHEGEIKCERGNVNISTSMHTSSLHSCVLTRGVCAHVDDVAPPHGGSSVPEQKHMCERCHTRCRIVLNSKK